MFFNLKFHTNPGKLSVKYESGIKIFSDMQDFKIFVSMYLYSKKFWGMCFCNHKSKPRNEDTEFKKWDPTERSAIAIPGWELGSRPREGQFGLEQGDEELQNEILQEKKKNATNVFGLRGRYYWWVCTRDDKASKKKKGRKTLGKWNFYNLKKKIKQIIEMEWLWTPGKNSSTRNWVWP